MDNLDSICRGADWDTDVSNGAVADYVDCCGGDDGSAPVTVLLYIQITEVDGVEYYRWIVRDADQDGDAGPVCRTRAEAEDGAYDYALEHDETPDIDSIISDILESGYFARGTSADDVRGLIDAMTSYAQGDLLVPAGGLAEWTWVTSGWLDCPYIPVSATHDSVASAAHELRDAIGTFQEEEEESRS